MVDNDGASRAESEARTRRFLFHGIIDQAIGVLMARTGCTSAEAFTQLVDVGRRSERPLAEIAADVVGEAAPPENDEVPDVRRRPAVLAMDRAVDGADLAWLLVHQALDWSGPAAAAVALAEQDDVLVLVGSTGFPQRAVNQWQTVPPAMDCLFTRAVRAGEPVWVSPNSPDTPRLLGEPEPPAPPAHGTRLATPLSNGRTLLGAVEIAWPTGTDFAPGTRREIAAVAQSVAAALFRLQHTGAPLVGREIPEDTEESEPGPLRRVDGAALWNGGDHRTRLLRMGRVGDWEWDLAAGKATWSREALLILGSRAPAEPRPLDDPPYTVHPDDAPIRDRLTAALAVDGRSADAELRIIHDDGVSHFVRIAGEAVLDAESRPTSVSGVVQDVTDRRRAETALEIARVQLAAQRTRVDNERQLAGLLQQIIMPAEPVLIPDQAGIDIAARYRPASAGAGVGGDWYGILPLDDGRVLMTVGDVAGHGLTAASAMAQLYHGWRGLAVTGSGPVELLHWLNTLTCELPSFTIASACCALYDPAARSLRWANAGHPPPVLVGADGPALLHAPVGTMLGAAPASSYTEAVAEVDPGDVVLFYTDGLVERRRESHDETTDHLLALTANPEPALERYLDRVLAGAQSDTDDDTCLIAVRFRRPRSAGTSRPASP